MSFFATLPSAWCCPEYDLQQQQLHLMFQGYMAQYADVQDASGAMQVLWTCSEHDGRCLMGQRR